MSKLIVNADKGQTVNLRKEPSKASEILERITIGKEVTLLERTTTEWYKIQYGKLIGYMMAQFLKIPTDEFSQEDLHEVYDHLKETLTLIEKILK